jgi:hypothetical protein
MIESVVLGATAGIIISLAQVTQALREIAEAIRAARQKGAADRG